MKRIFVITLLFLSSMPLFTQPEHITNFFKCGFPKLDDYKCFDCDTIKAQNPIEWELSEEYNQITIQKRLLARMAIMRTAAYLVIQDGKILFEEYWLNFDQNSKMNSFSVSKSIVALLIGIAIEERKIESINQKVKDFIPYFSQGKDSLLTIIDLLSMSSGLNWSEEFANPMSDIIIAYYGNSLDSLIRGSQVEETPGKKWNYQCGNTLLLTDILEKATGKKVYDYAQEKLWIPLGSTNDALWGKDSSSGTTKSFCCFYATPRDFAKLGLLVLNKGKFNGKQIVSEEYINIITTPSKWLKYKNKNVDFYGLHVWLVPQKKKIPYFSGMFGQYVFIIPEKNAVVVRFGEMLNELTIQPLPQDVKLYLKVAERILQSSKNYNYEN